MNEQSDAVLVAKFAHNGCEGSFAALVRRHIHLVHSVALRHTQDLHQAEDITQAVFIILARKAPSLGPKTVLSGWLYHTARLTAANQRRSEFRRTRREQEAFMQLTPEGLNPTAVWCELSPLLDEAMAGLRPSDRDAVVLRYFENRPLKEVGQAMGLEERAVQKRISRALDKLRRMLAKQGLTTTTAVIVGSIAANSVHAAPAELASTISAIALKGSAVAGTTMTLVKETLHMMTWIKAKTTVAIAASTLLVAGVAASIVHYQGSDAEPQTQTQAQQAKYEAERAGGPGNVATNPNANKAEDERKALSAAKN